jgi:putative nucleotidyltransferase with HDIG domain
MRDGLNNKISNYIENMPSLPVSVSKILEICNNPKTTARDLTRVISLDPVLVGRVLKLLNSAYYGFDHQITSLVRAIIMLGLNTVKNLALSTTVISTLVKYKKHEGLEMEGFWRHSLCVGIAAKLIARYRGIDPELLEEYFTAGLLHDIGKIPLNAILSKEYMFTVAAADRERIPLFRAEDAMLGINHCAAGAMISNAWRLSGAIGDAIIHHHNLAEYNGAHKDILYSIVAANHFASFEDIGFSGDRFPKMPEQVIWQTLSVSEETLAGIKTTVNREIEKARIFLKI